MKRLVGTIVIAAASIGLALNGGSASAQDEIHITDATAKSAPNIVNGSVLSTVSVELDGAPHRVSEVAITNSPKGELQGTILVETPGGELSDGTIMYFSHTPDLIPGSQVQLALESTQGVAGVGLAVAVDPSLDVYSVVDGLNGAYGLVADGIGLASAGGNFSLHGSSWVDFGPPVEFRINPSNSGLSSSATISAVKSAFQMWEDEPDSNVDFEYGGTTNKTGFSLGDGQNSVSWISSGGGWLAQASWITNGSGDILEFDVRVNRSYAWSKGASSGKFDIATVVGHEVGHGVGLSHPSSSAELMYFQIPSGSVKDLGNGDKAGIEFLYPREDQFCRGYLVTVDLALGQSPTSGDDVILGTPEADIINGLDGDDIICAGRGADIVHGGNGNDTIEGGHQGDYLYGDAGHDRLIGNSGNDRLYGDGGQDELFGNSGKDKLYGASGVDLLRGGEGNDSLWGDSGDDKLYGGEGNDTLRGDDGNDRLYGDDGDDELFGSDGDDELYGGGSNDVLNGNRGFDDLDGGGGNDDLDGGSQVDDCDGAAGIDTGTRCEVTASL